MSKSVVYMIKCFTSLSVIIVLILISFSFSITGLASGPELTKAQKQRDFEYLNGLVREIYPYTELNVREKGLNDIASLSDEYLQKAVATQNDDDYFAVFRNYLTQFQCGYHASIENLFYVKRYDTNQYLQYFFINGKPEAGRVMYWWAKERQYIKRWFVHSDLKISYRDGNYFLANNFQTDASRMIPVGSLLKKVNNLPADEYVKSLQTLTYLYFDPDYRKVYLPDPLITCPPDSSGWEVELLLPDQTTVKTFVPKLPGVTETFRFTPAVVCRELTETVGYIRFGNFSDQKEIYHQAIQEFLKKAGGKYEKLIIDIRGNKGGSQNVWMDSLMAPLIQKSIRYRETFAVKKNLLEKIPINKVLEELTNLTGFSELKNKPGFDKSVWSFFEVSREIKPQDSLNFNGQVYLLIDGYSYSASEKLAMAVKQTHFATIVGTRSGGGGVGIFIPIWCTLPESGILFRFEIDIPFNSDGTYNATHYTEPDIKMEPNPIPADFERDTLLKDPWVQKIIQNQI